MTGTGYPTTVVGGVIEAPVFAVRELPLIGTSGREENCLGLRVRRSRVEAAFDRIRSAEGGDAFEDSR
jgi:hypothetical protein